MKEYSQNRRGICYTRGGDRIISIKLCALCLLTVRDRAVNRGKRASVSSLSTVRRIHAFRQRGRRPPLVERLSFTHPPRIHHHRVLAIVHQLRRLQLVHRGQKFLPTFLLLLRHDVPPTLLPSIEASRSNSSLLFLIFSNALPDRGISIERSVPPAISQRICQRGIVVVTSANLLNASLLRTSVLTPLLLLLLSILVRGATLVSNHGRPTF